MSRGLRSHKTRCDLDDPPYGNLLLLDESVPIISLYRGVACVRDKALHVSNGHLKRSPRLTHHILFNHDATEIVGPIFEGDLAYLEPLGDPGTLYIWDIVQVNSAQSLHPKILACSDWLSF